MKNNSKKIVATIAAIFVLVLSFLIYAKTNAPKDDGVIIVELIDLEGKIVSSKQISFSKEDQIETLISNIFENVSFDNGMLMTIENYETPDDWSTFISVYVNDEMSMVGLPDIILNNGMKISLIITKFVS